MTVEFVLLEHEDINQMSEELTVFSVYEHQNYVLHRYLPGKKFARSLQCSRQLSSRKMGLIVELTKT